MNNQTKYGKWYYKVNNFDGTFHQDYIPVKILQETDKSYKIKLLGFANKYVPNEIIWVAKKKVVITSQEKPQQLELF